MASKEKPYKVWRQEADALLEMVGPTGSVSAADFARSLKELDKTRNQRDVALTNAQAAFYDASRYKSIVDAAGTVLKRILSATSDLVVDDTKRIG